MSKRQRKLPASLEIGATMAKMSMEIDLLKSLLRHADDVVIWEHTPARAGFREEIEAALGIGDSSSSNSEPK